METRSQLSDAEREYFLGGLRDPLTAQAIAMMAKRPVSPRELAAAAEQPVDGVRRHLDELRSTGLLALIEVREVEGSPEPFYHGPYIPFHDREEWEELDEDRKRAHLSLLARALKADLDEALEKETLAAWPDFHLCRIPFLSDEQGLEELRKVFDTALYESIRIIGEAEKRSREGDGTSVRGTAALMLFKLPELE